MGARRFSRAPFPAAESSTTSSVCSRAALRLFAPTRGCGPSSATARCRSRPRSGSRWRSPSTGSSQYDVAVHARAGRNAGLSLDEIDLARRFFSRDEKEAALLRYLESLLQNQGRVPIHLHEEAREQGWTDEQILEALAHVALADFAALISLGGEIPLEGTASRGKAAQRSRRVSRDVGAGATDHLRARRTKKKSVRITTRRSSCWASAGRARSSTRYCRARAFFNDRSGDTPDLRPAAVDAAEGTRGGGNRAATGAGRVARSRRVRADRQRRGARARRPGSALLGPGLGFKPESQPR